MIDTDAPLPVDPDQSETEVEAARHFRSLPPILQRCLTDAAAPPPYPTLDAHWVLNDPVKR